MNDSDSAFAVAPLTPVSSSEWEVLDARQRFVLAPRRFGKSAGGRWPIFGREFVAIIIDEWVDVVNDITRDAVRQALVQKPNKAARWFDCFRRWPGLAARQQQCPASAARVPRPAFSQAVARREKRRRFVQGLQ